MILFLIVSLVLLCLVSFYVRWLDHAASVQREQLRRQEFEAAMSLPCVWEKPQQEQPWKARRRF